MIELVKVRLRDGGKVKEMDCNGLQIKQGERVIVRSDEGLCICLLYTSDAADDLLQV